ncbi:MAG: hypothetical protein ACK56I_02405 [bacterium]
MTASWPAVVRLKTPSLCSEGCGHLEKSWRLTLSQLASFTLARLRASR